MRHHLPWPQNEITATCDRLAIQETLHFWLFLSATLENVTECDLNTLQDEWLLTWQALKQNTTRAYFWIKKKPNVLFPPWINVLIWRVSIGSPMATAPKKRILFLLVFAVQFHDHVVEHGRMWIVSPPPPWTADWSTLVRKRRAMASASNIANLLDFQGIRTKGRFCSYLNSVDDKWFMFTKFRVQTSLIRTTHCKQQQKRKKYLSLLCHVYR